MNYKDKLIYSKAFSKDFFAISLCAILVAPITNFLYDLWLKAEVIKLLVHNKMCYLVIKYLLLYSIIFITIYCSLCFSKILSQYSYRISIYIYQKLNLTSDSFFDKLFIIFFIMMYIILFIFFLVMPIELICIIIIIIML